MSGVVDGRDRPRDNPSTPLDAQTVGFRPLHLLHHRSKESRQLVRPEVQVVLQVGTCLPSKQW